MSTKEIKMANRIVVDPLHQGPVVVIGEEEYESISEMSAQELVTWEARFREVIGPVQNVSADAEPKAIKEAVDALVDVVCLLICEPDQDRFRPVAERLSVRQWMQVVSGVMEDLTGRPFDMSPASPEPSQGPPT